MTAPLSVCSGACVQKTGEGNVLKLNTAYTVTKLTVTGPGVEHPDDLLDNGTVNFTVTVKDWETGFSKQVTY